MYTVEFLRSRRVWFEELLYSPASSSTKRAHSLHVPGRLVAKTVLVKAGERFWVAALPSTSRVDLERLAGMLDAPGAVPDAIAAPPRLATITEMLATFLDCEPGVVPPFGRLYGLNTVCDSSLAEVDELAFAGNTRHEGLRMKSCDYIAVEGPVVGSFAVPIAAPASVLVPASASASASASTSGPLRPDRRAG